MGWGYRDLRTAWAERTVPAKATEPGVMTVPLSRQSSRLEQVSGGQPRAEKVSTGGGGDNRV